MKILLVHPDFDKASLIATQCQSKYDSEFVIVNNVGAGQTIFLQRRDFDIVILYDPHNVELSNTFHQIIHKRYKETHILHFADQSTKHKFPYKQDLYYLANTITSYLEAMNKHQNKRNEQSKYIKLHIEFLKHLKTIPTEISIIINEKYIRILNQNDTLTDDLIQKYKDKGIHYVYLSKLDKKVFTKKIANVFKEDLHSDNQNINQEVLKEDIFKLLTDVGLDPEVTSLANEAVGAVIYKIQVMPNLRDILQNVFHSDGGFRFKFSYMTGMIAFTLLNDPSILWATDTNKEAMIQASLFNDTQLNRDDWIQIRSEEDLLNKDFTDQEIEKINKHALMTSVEFKRSHLLPPEAAKIIKEHHGCTNGVGFAKELPISPPLHPLSYYYIVAEEFSYRILTSEHKKPKVASIITSIENDFHTKKISSIIQILKSNLKVI